MTTIESLAMQGFAHDHRLRIRLDDCGDPFIRGAVRKRDGVKCKRQLYFDGDQLCLMILDGAPVLAARWQALGGKLWLGGISRDAAGRRVQDVKITGIPPANAQAAIELVRAKPKRVMSEAQREVLTQARARLKVSGKGLRQSNARA